MTDVLDGGYDGPYNERDQSAELGYATRLAEAIWELTGGKEEAPHWKPLPDLMGVLTQIDNMTAGLIKGRPSKVPAMRLRALIEKKRYFMHNFHLRDFSPSEMESALEAAGLTMIEYNTWDKSKTALSEIEEVSDNCINAERYTAADALADLQEIRNIIKRSKVRP